MMRLLGHHLSQNNNTRVPPFRPFLGPLTKIPAEDPFIDLVDLVARGTAMHHKLYPEYRTDDRQQCDADTSDKGNALQRKHEHHEPHRTSHEIEGSRPLQFPATDTHHAFGIRPCVGGSYPLPKIAAHW